MSVKSIVTLMCDGTSLCFLLGLVLTVHICACESVSIDNERVSTDDNATRPEITTGQGTLRGINMRTLHNRSVYGFLGIPYAQPPIGNLRFSAPVPAGVWNGTLDASSDVEPCPQMNDQGIFVGIEDCLYLNVFTPQRPTSENGTLLPVLVYVIGGSFIRGEITLRRYGPDFLLDKDIVLVIPNFRVGVLGFLSTGDEVSPGNYALKDVLQALKWIQENIEYFGGDPTQVTLGGGSSGATAAHLLALSNSTNGLFHRLITHSGSALDAKVNFPKSFRANRAMQLGEYLDCPTLTSALLIECLRTLNASQIIDSSSVFHVWRHHPAIIWLPTYEIDVDGALLTESPANLTVAGKIRDIPWMTGLNRDEGIAFSLPFYEDPDQFVSLVDNIDLAIPLMTMFEGAEDEVAAYTAALKSYYLNDLSVNVSVLLTNFSHLVGDATFVYPSYDALQQQLLHAKSPQYFCSFEYRGTFSHTYFTTGGSTNYTEVSHGDEIIYLFRDSEARFGPSDSEYTESDWKMVDIMVQLWTSFVINGTPTIVDEDGVAIVWEPYSSRDNYLRLGNGSDTTLGMEYGYLEDRMRFWKEYTTSPSRALRHSLQLILVLFCLYSVFIDFT